ncbi:MAG: hypothetical protein Q9188_002452 [Gyalolechia gomerana]
MVQRAHRPRKSEPPAFDEAGQHHQVAIKEPQLKRHASKARLLGIFNRTRSTNLPTFAADQGLEGEFSTVQTRETSSTTIETPPPPEIADLVPTESIPPIEAGKQQPLKAQRTKSFKKRQSTTKLIPWDPPPLFQAYPQSVKHADVYAPNVPADTILRCNEKKRKQKKKDKISESGQTNGVDGEVMSHDEDQDGLQDLELVRKIYVLVTSGYFLQYAGEGSFDRLPEKIMPIGQDSAAFASDAIPGKHWVLQVSHASDENGEAKLEKWSLVKRLGIRGDAKRCSASNYLLILDSPEDLDNWLSIVRREIEAWGGKRYQPDLVVRPNPDEVPRTLRQKLSRQYLVKRDPNQFSNNAIEWSAACEGAVLGGTPTAGTRKHSTATQESVHSPSTSNMTASTDQNLLERLRSSPRISRVSTEAKTYSTSREASPVPSPTNIAFHLEDFISSHEQSKTADPSAMVPSPSSRSLSATRCPPVPVSSSAAPNFSVPNFSIRYSGAYSTPPLSTTSSSTSNPARKPVSPLTVKEQHDSLQDSGTTTLDNIRTQEPRSSEAPSTDDMSRRNLALADRYDWPVMPESSSEALCFHTAVPRRFSSLEYSRGISPVKSWSPKIPSPHPPPTSALPALPKSSSKTLSAPPENLRRPFSTQIHSSPLPSSSAELQGSLPIIPSPPAKILDPQLSPPSRDPPPPPLLPLSSSVRYPERRLLPPSKVLNRRSMPHLGLPPSDPPNCPLPTPPVPRLPPIRLSSGSLSRSMERPLRTGLGTRTVAVLDE